MDRTLILHVGLPKGGSTSLQEAMATSGDVLAKHGVLFVRLRPIKKINALAAGGHDEWPRIIGDDPPELVVLSSEFLCTLTRRGIDGLLSGLADKFDRIRVVFVLRHLDDWVRSRMNQKAQGLPGRAPTIDDDPISIGVGMHVGEPDEWLATWSQWVSEEPETRDLVVLPLAGTEPLPKRFLAAIDRPEIKLDYLAAETWTNRSVDEQALELIQEMRDLSEVMRLRLGLESIRDDDELYSYVKRVIGLAKRWDRPANVQPSPESLRAANKTANAIRDGLVAKLEEPLLSEVLAIVGTRESARMERKARKRSADTGST